jgi:hypothetical protein
MHPSELEEQIILAKFLDWQGILWFHPPNEGRRSWRTGATLKRAGMKSGVPDVMICARPPNRPNCIGTAIELKRVDGGQVTANQQRWIEALRKEGWVAEVCHGADKAIKLLGDLGYDQRQTRSSTERELYLVPDDHTGSG